MDPETRKVLGRHVVVARPTFFEDFALRGVPLDKSIFEGLPEEPSAKAGE